MENANNDEYKIKQNKLVMINQNCYIKDNPGSFLTLTPQTIATSCL